MPFAITDQHYEDAESAGQECCRRCRFAFGPLFLACGCEASEFYEGPVHPLGWCADFEPEE